MNPASPDLLPLPRAGVELQADDAARYVAFTGLTVPEAHGRWTDGPDVSIALRLPEVPDGGVVLRIESLGFVARNIIVEQRAEIRANGTRLTEWSVLDATMRVRSLVVPPGVIGADGHLVLALSIPSCVQPAALRLSDDRRFLGLLLRRISWEPRAGRWANDFLAARARPVGRESRKSFDRKIDAGFWTRFVTGPNVLDIGWRGGTMDDSVVPILPGAIGVDLDYPGYDGRILPFADASQDAVYSSHCLEHIADHIKAIQEWHRVLRVGGHIITVVPSAHLYERRRRVPSFWNNTHLRVYTPATLLAEFEAALVPNSYRVRHLAENDADYQYDFSPYTHPEGCYEIELVVEKIATPGWSLMD